MTTNHRIFLAFFLTAMTIGCVGPALESMPVPDVPIAWQTTTTDTSPLSVYGWLDDFATPQLHDLVTEGLANNHDLKKATYRWLAVKAKIDIAAAGLWPTVKAELDSSRAHTVGSTSGTGSTRSAYSVEASVSWEPDVWGRLAAITNAAELEASAAATDVYGARLSVAANVVRNWFRVVESEQQVGLAERSLQNYRRAMNIIEEKYRSGLVDALDLRLARTDTAQAEGTLALRRRDQSTILRGMEAVLGRYPGLSPAIGMRLPKLLPAVPVGLPADLLVRRPDLVAAERRLAAAGAQVEVKRRNRLPTLRLSASSGTSSQELRDLLDWDRLVWNLVGGLVQPILQGGKLKAEEALARIERKQAWIDYAQAVLTALQEVEIALESDALYRDQEVALGIAAKEAVMAAELAVSRYRNGLVEIVTLLESQRRAYNAKSAHMKVARERLDNRITLYLALGGDFKTTPSDNQSHTNITEYRP